MGVASVRRIRFANFFIGNCIDHASMVSGSLTRIYLMQSFLPKHRCAIHRTMMTDHAIRFTSILQARRTASVSRARTTISQRRGVRWDVENSFHVCGKIVEKMLHYVATFIQILATKVVLSSCGRSCHGVTGHEDRSTVCCEGRFVSVVENRSLICCFG
jgi:hypothetical protein